MTSIASISSTLPRLPASDALLIRGQPTDRATKRCHIARPQPDELHDSMRESEKLQTYEPDDGLLTEKEMAAIRLAAGPVSYSSVCASLF